MERYRVNYTLLIALFVGTIVLAGGGFAFYKYQASRNASTLLSKADEAEQEGDLKRAAGFLTQYLAIRKEDKEVATRHANMRLEVSKLPDREPSDVQLAYAVLENTVRNQPENSELRRKLVDELMEFWRQPQTAIKHIEYLLNETPTDKELLEMRLTCLRQMGKRDEAIDYAYQLIGYDSAKEEFDDSKAKTADVPSVYRQLANALKQDNADPSIPERMVDKLVERNPEMSDAYLVRAQYLQSAEREDEASADVEKALEIDPDNVDALLEKVEIVMASAREGGEEAQEEAYEQSYNLLKEGAQSNKSEVRIYRMLALLERQRGDQEAALAQYDAGIEAVEDLPARILEFEKTGLLLDMGKAEEAAAAIKNLEEKSFPAPYIAYLNARKMVLEEQWYQAAEELSKLAPIFQTDPRMGVELNQILGLSYERLGQREKARDAYEVVLSMQPSNTFAKAGVARINAFLSPTSQPKEAENQSITQLIAQELRKPAEEQDWDAFERKLVEYGEEYNTDPAMLDLLRAEVFLRRGIYDKARRMVSRARKENPDSIAVWRAALRVLSSDPERGPIQALRNLDTVVGKFGDIPLLRLDRADFLIMLNDEKLPQQLMDLTEGIDDWDKNQKSQLWEGLATRFGQIRDVTRRQQALMKVAELSPNELPTLEQLFRSAIAENSPERIEDAQQRILNVVGSKDRATYLWTEANKIIWQVGRGMAEESELEKAEKLIEQAMLQREDWHELYLTEATLALARGNKTGAIKSYEKALQLGPPNVMAVVRHVALLLEGNRFQQAFNVLEKINKPARQRLFGRRYAAILLNTGQAEEALLSAAEVEQAGKENGETQLWYGKFLLQASNLRSLSEDRRLELRERASEAISKAVELNPDSQEAWLAKIGYLMGAGKPLDAEDVLREAQLALSEDQLQLVLGRSYEALGRWFDALNIYRELYEQNPDNIATARLLATFYLSPRYPKQDGEQLATPLINQILRSAEDQPDDQISENVLWARQTGAEILAKSNDYQKILKAQDMLASNVINGSLRVSDKVRMARILASRPEPVSRVKAIGLYEDVKTAVNLPVNDEARLGTLYYSTGDWDAARDQMLTAISRYPKSATLRDAYIKMLLNRGGSDDIQDATRQLKRLKEIAPTAQSTLQLIVRVASKIGQKRQARAAIQQLVPKDMSKANPQSLLLVARLLTELDDLDNAESLYRFVASRNKNALVMLADFLGTKRDIEQSFELLEKAKDELGLGPVIATSLNIVRDRRSELGGEYDARIQSWLDKALREDPESIPLLLQQAELYDMQRKPDDAATIYRNLLDRDDIQGLQRAVVLNNLGYLLALKGTDQATADEALKYVEEAIEILGPQADILDTRAVAYTAKQNYSAAIRDLDLSVTDNPTASKYFHLARAHMLANQEKKAVQAWEQALELGLTRDGVAVAEQEQFDAVQARMTDLGSQSASL